MIDDVLARVDKLAPKRGEVVIIDLVEDASAEDLGALADQLAGVSRTGATVLILPVGVTVETIDEREMLARGWMRVGPVAHTTEQLAAPPAAGPEQLPSA